MGIKVKTVAASADKWAENAGRSAGRYAEEAAAAASKEESTKEG